MVVRPSVAELPKTLIGSISAVGNGALAAGMGVNPIAVISIVLLGLGISAKEFFDRIREKNGKNDEDITEDEIFEFLGEISSDLDFIKERTLVDRAAFSIAVENLSDVDSLPSADLDGDRPEKHHRMFFEWIEREFRNSSDRNDFNQRVQRQIGKNLVFKIRKLEEKQRALFDAQNEALNTEWKSFSEALNRIETTGEDTNARVRNIEKNLTPAPVILHGAAASIRPPVSDFAGRTADIDALESLAQSGAIVSGVRGTGGIGKTELARELARRWNGKFVENYEIDCLGAGDDPFTSVQIIERLLRIWHPTAQLPEDVNNLASILHGELGKIEGGVLLLLDNVADLNQVKPLFPLPTGCAALITSRRKFAMAGMKTHDLEEMDLPDAVALLRSITERLDDATATELATVCGCLPKALRLAGEAIAQKPIPPATWLERFRSDRLKHLDEVERALEISLELLDSDANRLAFYHLGVFTASFPRDAAQTVLAEIDAETSDQCLENLHFISLIDYCPETDRFELHDLAREYAVKLCENAEYTIVFERMAAWAEDKLRDASEKYKKGHGSVLQALAWFDQERDIIEAVWEWAASNYNENQNAARTLATLPGTGAYLFDLRQQPSDQVNWLEAQIRAFQKLGDRRGEGGALGNLGSTFLRLGEIHKALESQERSLAIMCEIGDRKGEGVTLGNLGNVWAKFDQKLKAISFYERALEISREFSDRSGEGKDLGNIGLAWSDLGENERAIEIYEERITLSREVGDLHGEAITLGNLGIAWSRLGEERKAIKCYERHLEISREIGDLRGEGNALGNLGIAWAEFGNAARAIEFYEQQLKICRDIDDRYGEANALWNIAFDEPDKQEKAIKRAEEALIIFEEIESPTVEKVRAYLKEWRGE